MLDLVARCVEVTIMVGKLFFTIRASVDAATAAVEADAAFEALINVPLVNVVDYVYVDAIDGAVVEELAPAPFASEETDAWITEAVVNSTIKTDVGPPIATMPDVNAVTPAPVARSPEQPGLGSHHPSARHPIVAVIAVGPIAGRPDVARAGADRLRVDGEGRRADSDRHADADLRVRGSRYGEKYERKQKQMQETIFTHHCHLDEISDYNVCIHKTPRETKSCGCDESCSRTFVN